jgi:CRISPR-associated protein Cmr3
MEYKIELTPITPIFFADKDLFKYGKKNYYYIKSRKMPIQTTLMGMIRKEILIIQGKYKDNFSEYSQEQKKQLKDVIGDLNGLKSIFSSKDSLEENINLGIIERISALYITKKEQYLFQMPFNYVVEKGKVEELSIKKCENANFYLNGKDYKIPAYEVLGREDLYKNKNNDYFIDSEKNKIKHSEIFKKFDTNHNHKNKDKKTDYYMVNRYKILPEYKFVFYLTTNQELKIKNEIYENIVYMGGEGTYFKIKITEEKEKKIKLSRKKDRKNSLKQILLLSDSYLPKEIYEDCVEFSISESTEFQVKSKNSNTIYDLYKAGSVFYTEKIEKLKEYLESYKNARKFGFNNYIEILGDDNND